MKKKISELNLAPKEKEAIQEFSKRIKKSLRKELLQLFLFGSKARGDFHNDSDIDIYIVVKKRDSRILDKVSKIDVAVWNKFDVFLSPVVFSFHEEKKNLAMHSFFFEAVQKEGIPI